MFNNMMITVSIISGLILSGCNSNVPSCSGPGSKIASKILEDSNTIPWLTQGSSNVTYNLVNIGTVSSTERSVLCKFDVAVKFTEANGESGSTTLSEMISRRYQGMIRPQPLSYTIETTDEGKLYVTVYGLN